MTLSSEGVLYGRHVLIVDDSLVGLAWSRYVTTFGGGTATVCPTVRLARRQLGLGDVPAPDRMPDILLIDFQLAGHLTGSHLAAELRTDPQRCTILRVAISGYPLDHITAGFDAPHTLYHTHLATDVTPQEVAPTLAALLQCHSTGAALRLLE